MTLITSLVAVAALYLVDGFVNAQDPSSGITYVLNIDPADVIVQCGVANIAFNTTPTLNTLTAVLLTFAVESGDGTTKTISRDIPLGSNGFSWNPVNVPGGSQYFLRAVNEGGLYSVNGASPVFMVNQSGNSSCLATSSVPPSSPSTTPPQPSSTPNSSDPQSSAQSTSSSLVAPIPISATTSSGISAGAKAGIAIAAVVVAVGALVGLWFLLAARRNNRRSRMRASTAMRETSGGNGSGYPETRSWQGLASADYRRSSSGGHAVSPTSTTETKLEQGQDADALGRSIGAGLPTTVSTFSDTSNDKLAGYAHHPSDVPGLAYLPQQHQSPHSPTAPVVPAGITPVARSSSGSSSSRVDAGVSRGSKGPTPRKPVPVYSPTTEEEEQTPTRTRARDSADSFLDPFSSRPSSSEELTPPSAAGDHALAHKSSFGYEKPMTNVLAVDPPIQRVASPPINQRG